MTWTGWSIPADIIVCLRTAEWGVQTVNKKTQQNSSIIFREQAHQRFSKHKLRNLHLHFLQDFVAVNNGDTPTLQQIKKPFFSHHLEAECADVLKDRLF